MEQIIKTGLEALGLLDQVPSEAPAQLAEYGRLMLEKNQVMNLTAITDEEGVARLHMLDSAALLLCADFQGGKTLIDVGTGAGLPGLPLKILVPSLQVTLLDSLGKRVRWLETVGAALGLEGVTYLHARGEEAAHQPELREQFDFAVSRAVAALPLLCELCLPYIKVGGRFLAMKSVDSAAEVEESGRAVSKLGGRLLPAVDYAIPGAGVTHRVVAVEKLAPTPAAYPRRWPVMQKKPL